MSFRRWLAPASAVLMLGGAALADERVPYTLDVEDASAKVGEPTAVHLDLLGGTRGRMAKLGQLRSFS